MLHIADMSAGHVQLHFGGRKRWPADNIKRKQATFREEYTRNSAPWCNDQGRVFSVFLPGIAVIIWYRAARVEGPTVREMPFAAVASAPYNYNQWQPHRNATPSSDQAAESNSRLGVG